jgi:uncharacterized protein (UPF0548 family)
VKTGSIAEQTVTYASVGGTQAPDLMRYPPRGFRPLELRGRVGHGDARWAFAVDQLLTGGIYRGAGLSVQLVPASGEQDAAHYVPVEFDEHGQPVAPAALEVPDDEFSAQGEPYLRAGDSVVVGPTLGSRVLLRLPGRVVLRENEQNRVLIVVGTLPGHPLSGEESFLLEREADDSVWLTVRSFARAARAWAVAAPTFRVARRRFARRFLLALSAPIDGGVVLPSQLLADDEARDDSAPTAEASRVNDRAQRALDAPEADLASADVELLDGPDAAHPDSDSAQPS